ncbi:MAG: prenyltransferase/squalene oxidase repeat-containing protein [Planctomycetota bacterium]|jgi:hypothetical protein
MRTNRVRRIGIATALLLAGLAPSAALAQDGDADRGSGPDLEAARRTAIERLLEMQEGDEAAEWPYEGVYRVRGEIPIGYRVGGTSICATALVSAPGYGQDAQRIEAVARAVEFVCAAVDHPLMSHDVRATYDVRGWGYAYGLTFLLRLRADRLIPAGMAEPVERAVRFYLEGIERTEIPQAGGWNYARRGGFDRPGPPSPFMTGPTLQALFEARAQGFEFDQAVVERGLDALAAARTSAGSFLYAGRRGAERDEPVPGAVGRMLVGETTLFLADRSDLARVRGALDAFLAHWEWLERRRARNGTHQEPYGIAPYYFFYAHYYAAQAIELLPAGIRDEYRQRLLGRLFQVRQEDGIWNDRVFPRTANYSTAMVLLALLAPEASPPARWSARPSGDGSPTPDRQP